MMPLKRRYQRNKVPRLFLELIKTDITEALSTRLRVVKCVKDGQISSLTSTFRPHKSIHTLIWYQTSAEIQETQSQFGVILTIQIKDGNIVMNLSHPIKRVYGAIRAPNIEANKTRLEMDSHVRVGIPRLLILISMDLMSIL